MLPFALVVVMVAALLIGLLLAHVSSGHRTTSGSGAVMERQYASDAGVELGIHRLQTDGTLRHTLMNAPSTPVSLDWPTSGETPVPVNQVVPIVDVVCLGAIEPCTAKLNWVLWAGSDSGQHTITTSGGGHTIVGDIHSNHHVDIRASGHAVGGTITYVGEYSGPEAFVREKLTTTLPLPFAWSIADFDLERDGKYAIAAEKEGKYYRHVGDWNPDLIEEGLHYVTGKASLIVSGERVTIVSEDSISVSGSDMLFTPYLRAGSPRFLCREFGYRQGHQYQWFEWWW